MRDASVVVVTHNALPWIERCLESVRGEEVVVVDNGSSDGSADVVREQLPDARVIEQENLGLAAGWNRGIEAASGRYFLILNSDAWLTEGSLRRLVAFADQHPDAAIVGRRCSTPTDRCHARCRASRPSGGSRPSTSSSASWRRGRVRSTPSTPAASTTRRCGRPSS